MAAIRKQNSFGRFVVDAVDARANVVRDRSHTPGALRDLSHWGIGQLQSLKKSKRQVMPVCESVALAAIARGFDIQPALPVRSRYVSLRQFVVC